MRNTDRVFNLLASMPDDMLSYSEMQELLDLRYKQLTRAVQSLMERNIIFKYTDKDAGIGRGRGKKAYFGLEEKAYANITRVS